MRYAASTSQIEKQRQMNSNIEHGGIEGIKVGRTEWFEEYLPFH
jgi:hypothetical protein